MAYCLPEEKVNRLKQAIIDGELNPEVLANMATSQERREFLAKIVGEEDAKEVNAQVESKLILKNQQTGMINLFKSLTGIAEPVRRDIISRIEKMTNILTPENEDAFFEDLATKKLGTEITVEEAGKLATLSKELSDAKAAIPKNSPIGSDARLAYGAKYVEMNHFISDLKESNKPTLLEEVKDKPISASISKLQELTRVTKGLKAVGDLSAYFRQGGKALFTNPSIWAKEAVSSISNVARQMTRAGTDYRVMDAIQADIQSRPNALNGNYKKMGLSVSGGPEDFIPVTTKVLNKIPVFGRVFEATRVGFIGFIDKVRADVADKMINIAQNTGVDLTDEKQLPAIGQMVNSLTGRGTLGRLNQASDVINSVFFSPRYIKSNFDFLTAHTFSKDVTPFVRKQAAYNLLKVIIGMASIYQIAKTLQPKSVTDDPHATNFGKVVIDGIAYDYTTGSGSLATLAARVAPLLIGKKSYEITSTGKKEQLNTGKFGAPTGFDMIVNFLSDKEAPVASIITDLAKGQTFSGTKPTVGGEALGAITPFPLENVLSTESSVGLTGAIISELVDALGIYETPPYIKPKK